MIDWKTIGKPSILSSVGGLLDASELVRRDMRVRMFGEIRSKSAPSHSIAIQLPVCSVPEIRLITGTVVRSSDVLDDMEDPRDLDRAGQEEKELMT